LDLQEPDDLLLDISPEKLMPQNNLVTYHSNRYHAESACQHCEGVIRHERWCLALNPLVYYACEIVIYPDKLTIGDAIILHSLGVLWRHPYN
jgi:glycerol-3-phosphate cytidylyltransferase-like family protein